jgi:hypothetical protein
MELNVSMRLRKAALVRLQKKIFLKERIKEELLCIAA